MFFLRNARLNLVHKDCSVRSKSKSSIHKLCRIERGFTNLPNFKCYLVNKNKTIHSKYFFFNKFSKCANSTLPIYSQRPNCFRYKMYRYESKVAVTNFNKNH